MWLTQVESDGFAILRDVLTPAEVSRALSLLNAYSSQLSAVGKAGARDVLDSIPDLRQFAWHPNVRTIVHQVLGEAAFLVRATLFDKTAITNWKVPWHQDLTIAVKDREDVAGYGPWSVKAGVRHVQPPSEVLERMITVRLHLDPCGERNGALRVMPGSHRVGRINQNHVADYLCMHATTLCSAQPGDALVMRPLLLHASSASARPMHRRVLHFDYAVGTLAGGLKWHMKTPATVG